MAKRIDPTQNVKELVALEMRRQDDLRDAEARRVDDLMELRADYDAQLRIAEAKRIDAIRAVDVNAVSVASERANQQASVLANQVALRQRPSALWLPRLLGRPLQNLPSSPSRSRTAWRRWKRPTMRGEAGKACRLRFLRGSARSWRPGSSAC